MLPLPEHLALSIERKIDELSCKADDLSLCARLEELISGNWSPKVQDVRCLKTDTVLYKEVLYAPRGGAGSFFSALEEHDDSELFNACSHALSLHIMSFLQKTNAEGPFGFNVEGTEILDAALCHQKQLEMTRLFPLGGLVIEITERDCIAKYRKEVEEFIGWAHRHNFKVALDDFGAGAHCMDDVKSLTIDYLKIDGSVVNKIMGKKSDACCESSRTAIAYCAEKAIPVIAEHAECTAQELLEAGFTHVQSYSVSEPVNLRVRKNRAR